jgi:hypothetical protein
LGCRQTLPCSTKQGRFFLRSGLPLTALVSVLRPRYGMRKEDNRVLRKIISGGQTGIDIAGLRAARAAGFETGGWMPKGWITDAGRRPEYATLYGMKQTASPKYPPRTAKNIATADATLIIARDPSTSGTALTRRIAQQKNHPFLQVLWIAPGQSDTPKETVAAWLNDFAVVNVAGNRATDLEGPVAAWLEQVFTLARETATASATPALSPAKTTNAPHKNKRNK